MEPKCAGILQQLWVVAAITILISIKVVETMAAGEDKVCIGTDGKGRLTQDEYKARYEGCTHILGNLEIFYWFSFSADCVEEDTAFFREIKEITGYLRIESVTCNRLIFQSLHTIRGQPLFRVSAGDPEYALLTVSSEIEHLEFPVLKEISNGSVGLYFRKRMCFLESINWQDIMMGEDAQFHYYSAYDINGHFLYYKRDLETKIEECEKCDASCEGGCWGTGPNMCQNLSKVHCTADCRGGRCFGTEPGQCCHSSCIGGCNGPNKTDCFGCRNAYIDGECQESCPPGKFTFVSSCVDACPNGTLVDEKSSSCLFKCHSKMYPKNGKCEALDPSDRICRTDYFNYVHSGNIEQFRNCTIIEGDIKLNEIFLHIPFDLFKNFTCSVKTNPISYDALEVFKTVREISGTLELSYIGNPWNSVLECFENLEVIGRSYRPINGSALTVHGTRVKTIRFRKLRKIYGGVDVSGNQHLCYFNTINWTAITSGQVSVAYIMTCGNWNQICSGECSSGGCWGDLEEDCACPLIFEGSCVSNCPETTYESDGVCLRCNENCREGCSGPLVSMGPNGCNSCHQAMLPGNGTIICMKDGGECSDGYRSRDVDQNENGDLKSMTGYRICEGCSPKCSTDESVVWKYILTFISDAFAHAASI